LTEEKRLVWDLPLRLFHWLLVLSLAASWATAKAGFEWTEIHFWLGYFTLGLLVFRILWGFVGPRHARFSSFLKGPGSIWQYARGLIGGPVVHTVGHNPLGGLMVVVMLALLLFQGVTGLFATDDIVWSGPYNPAVSGATGKQLTSLHHANFNFILAAVALHILAIAYYGFVKRQNLVVAMLTGKKAAVWVPADQEITRSELVKAIIVIAISAALIYWLISAAPVPPSDDYF